MAALHFYVCVILKLTLVAGQSVHYVLKGREAVLSPALPMAPDDILWKHNGNKVITFDSAEERVFPPFDGRVTLSWGTAELSIADVGYEDSGEYELDALIRDRLHRSQFLLKVLDKVSKPAIRCEMNDEKGNSSSARRATLHCSSESNTPEALTFKWNLEGKSILGQTLTIVLGDDLDHIEYSCTATNPLHAETSVFMAKDCHTEGSSKALDIIVPIVIASLILLAFCIFPFIFRHQIKRACFKQRKRNDLEKQTTVTDYQNKEEGTPLMGDIHRQETFASKHPLIQQTDFVRETPQKEEKVKKRFKKFANRERTESHPDTETEEENHTDIGEMVTPQHPSPIRNGQVDSEGEKDLHMVPKLERGSDDDSSHYEDASETAAPQDLQPKPGEHESRGQTDSEGEPDAHHSDQKEEPETDVALSAQVEATKAPEQAGLLTQPHLQESAPQEDKDLQLEKKGLAEFNEDLIPESPENQEPPENKPVSTQPEVIESQGLRKLGSQSDSDGSETKEQIRSDEESAPAPEVSDPQRDASHNASEESEQPNDSQMSSPPSEQPESQNQSPPQSPLASVQDSKPEPLKQPEPDPVDKDPQNHGSESLDNEVKKAEDAALTSQSQTSDSKPSELGSQSDSDGSETKEQIRSDEESTPVPEVSDPQRDASHNESVTSELKAAEESEQPNDSQMSSPPSEQPESQNQSPPQSPLASVQDSKPEPLKQPEPDPVDKDPQNHRSESLDNEVKKAEDAALTSQSQPSDSEPPESSPQSPSLSSFSADKDSESGIVESEDEKKTDSDQVSKTEDKAAQRNSDHESDTSDNNVEDAALTNVQSLPSESIPPEVDSASSQSDSEADVEEVKGHEEMDHSADKELQKQDSSSEEFEESKQTSTTIITPAADSELTGSEKESDESTHPPASPLSQPAHNKQSKDTDAEIASSVQVSEETKDNTDKESESSGSEQINEATKSKEGQQQS